MLTSRLPLSTVSGTIRKIEPPIEFDSVVAVLTEAVLSVDAKSGCGEFQSACTSVIYETDEMEALPKTIWIGRKKSISDSRNDFGRKFQ